MDRADPAIGVVQIVALMEQEPLVVIKATALFLD